MNAPLPAPATRGERDTAAYDAVVVGAGFAGMYMLHVLRKHGFSARVFEAGTDVGGTWYWNRYPGARVDIESMQYSYSFSEELDQEWTWSEKYAPQPEILRYAQHVADRFDLRRDIRFKTRVTSARYDETAKRWAVETDRGDRVTARFCIMAVGCLSSANKPPFEGVESFRGPIYHTGEWPHEGVEFTGKRVAVIGTGSSGIQSIPIIASQADQLYVFQRTPNFTVPAWNSPVDPVWEAEVKADYPALRAKARARPTGFYFKFNTKPALEANEEERRAVFEEFWSRGGLPFLGAFGDLLFDKTANETIAEFARGKIREIVKDPATAELLSPKDVFGCKRLCVDTGYFETYNRPNVQLVDISQTGVGRISPAGVVANGEEYAVDTIVCATGFAAMTGSFDKIDIRGRDGMKLTKAWEAGPRTYLGLATVGFPNFLMITGPGSPSVLAQMIQSIEQHADWMVDCLCHLRDTGADEIEPTLEAQDAWVDHVNEVAAVSLRSTCSSWYVGANIPGRPRVFMPYIGGFPIYVQKCNEVQTAGYDGFTIDSKKPIANAEPTVRETERWRVPLDLEVISPAMLASRQVPVV